MTTGWFIFVHLFYLAQVHVHHWHSWSLHCLHVENGNASGSEMPLLALKLNFSYVHNLYLRDSRLENVGLFETIPR